ncbi:MAG: ATP-binding protein [Candidatus Baldrarchaeia archaeon]
MSIPILILGESGTGKSASMMNLDKDKTLLIQVVSKPLPFKNTWKAWDKSSSSGQIIITDRYDFIIGAIKNAESWGKEIVIIDDFQYVMANEFMRRSSEKGYEKFTEIAKHAWEIIITSQEAANIRVYFLSHSETNEGKTKAKTIGKLLDEKITLEGLFTVVLKTAVTDDGYFFDTKNSGSDTTKAPMGMFDNRIKNDLSYVDQQITEYYGEQNV